MAVSFRSCSFVGIHPQLAAAVLSRKRPHLFSIAFAVSINHLDVSFSYGVSNKALEFQKDRILQATEMSCGCVVLREMEDEEETKSKSGSLKWRIFPFYAMESLKLNANSRKVISDFESSADPIWDSIRAEAKSEAEKEPILSSFLYASVLSHDCLERALGFVVANRLQNPTLLATQLMDIFDKVMMNDRGIQRSIRLDVQGYHSLQSYRVAHALWNQGRKILALALQSRISEVFAVDIHPAAKIGEGILLDHGTGLVIGETAVVGNRVSLMQGITLGGTGKETGDRHPKIGNGALIGAGATVLGNIVVGEGAMVAAGSLVLKDIPPHNMVAGNPAKIVGHVEEEDPSLTMKHDAAKDLYEHTIFCSAQGVNGILHSENKR